MSMVTDESGNVHAAAVRGNGVVYLTNASGNWTLEEVSDPSGEGVGDREPSISIDADGTVAVAFDRSWCGMMFCSPASIFVATRDATGWSEPAEVVAGDQPSLQIRDSKLHLAYAASEGHSDVACAEPTPLRYVTDATGQWVDQRVARHGGSPRLQIGSDGRARIVFGDSCEFLGTEGIFYAEQERESGSFHFEPIPGTTSESDRLADMALDSQDVAHALFSNLLSVRGPNGWSEPELVIDVGSAVALGVGPNGDLHALALGDSGVWYVTNRSGQFVSEQLSDKSTWSGAAADVAVDVAGRPHVLFTTGTYSHPTPGLTYVVGS